MEQSPFLIGIAGPSGSGKTALAVALAERLGRGRCGILPLDAYYRDLSSLEPELRAVRNFDHPGALDQALLAKHVRRLARGVSVERPIYRFDTHSRDRGTVTVAPSAVLVLEGLFTLRWGEIRKRLALRVFVEAADELCRSRRIARDTRERGRTERSVGEQCERTVRPMCERYVLPTRRFAELVVRGDRPLGEGVDSILSRTEGS
jgi:uridine kinase